MGRKAYSTDLTDAQWTLIDPFLRAWKAKRPSPSGHEGRYDLREIVNALFYQNRTGCQWAYLPHDLPPKSATYYLTWLKLVRPCFRIDQPVRFSTQRDAARAANTMVRCASIDSRLW